MRLRELRIRRLPGIAEGFALEDLDPGVNVIVGPNASGKTSVLRALRAALYADEQRDAPLHVEATFDDGAGRLTAVRLGRDLTWQRQGQGIEPPPLPEYRFLSCYTLRIEDLLDAEATTDQEIAQRLARELAGGYDLPGVRHNWPFQLKQSHGRSERKEWDDARDRQREIQRGHRALREDEGRLAGLRDERDACADAAREAQTHGKALELLEARRRRKALEGQWAAFPDGMERLRGDEPDRLQRLREMLGARHDELRRARREHEDALRRLDGSGLAESSLEEGALADRRHRLQHLQDLEQRTEQLRGELERARAARQAAIDALGGEPGRLPRLQPDTLHEVEEQLTRKRGLDAERRELDAALAGLPTGSDDDPDITALRQGRDALLSWLAAPPGRGRRGAGAAVMVLLTAVLTGIGAAAATVHWGLSLLGLPVAAIAYLLLRPSPATAARAEARRRFTACALAEPAAWETGAVMTRLTEIDRQLSTAERRAEDLALREKTERRRAALDAELRELDAALAELATRVGFDPRVLDSAFDRWLRLVGDYDRAHTAAEQAGAALDARLLEAQEQRTDLLAFLAEYGEAPRIEPPDSAVLRERLERLAARIRRRDDARRDIGAAQREMERAARSIEETDAQIRELFAGAGLEAGDEAGLDRRLGRLSPWEELRKALEQARSQEQDRAQALGEHPDLTALVEADDAATLKERCGALEAQAAREKTLSEEITRIETLLGQARRKRELQEARAACQVAEDALRERLEEAQFAAVGAFLLDRVRDEHVHASQPPALRRADEWFQRFTHHQYALEFADDGGQRFAARETATEERRRLAELSSGTRMQLLLAVRIAFALEAERGREPLPLLLDEALTTADPERFAAAAQSLSTLARENGRQVIYLTAQPGDVGYWRAHGVHARCIDLAEVRRTGRAVTDGRRLATPPAEVPPPGDRSPEDYAVALGVPPVDPWSAPAAVHVFYLLRDDLALLHRLLVGGIRRIGPLRALLDSPAAPGLLTEEQRVTLRRRVDGVEPWVEAWRQGRGRPVDRQALADSQAVSPTFLDGVAALTERLGGDARALIRALEGGEVDRFRSNKREDLRRWLAEHGYLDERPRLDDARILQRVLAVLGAFHDDRDRALAEARLLCASLNAGSAAAG